MFNSEKGIVDFDIDGNVVEIEMFWVKKTFAKNNIFLDQKELIA